MTPDEVVEALPVIRVALRGDRPRPGHARPLGPHLAREPAADPGAKRSALLAAYREVGVDRVMAIVAELGPRRWGARDRWPTTPATPASSSPDADRMISVERLPDVDAFLAAAGPFLAEREAEHNLLLGIGSNLQAGARAGHRRSRTTSSSVGPPAGSSSPRCGPRPTTSSCRRSTTRRRCRPWPTPRPSSSSPASRGRAGHAGAFAERWGAAVGRPPRLVLAERIFRLTRVRPPRGAAGSSPAGDPGRPGGCSSTGSRPSPTRRSRRATRRSTRGSSTGGSPAAASTCGTTTVR